jgi:flavin-dependent thymidylate synthase
MQVYLAGFNVDATVLKELQEKSGERQDVTPEVLSAAYARISRDPRPINEIRKDARKEVQRSRKSNETIIFKMGHHSVAEHAIFNLDIIGLSRLAMEEAEKFRLCSYTEKSQRYITLDKDFVLPKEIKGTGHEEPFIKMVQLQNEAYFKLFEKLKEYVFKKHKDLAADARKHSLLEGWAKEDARYITALATESQVGITINARILELALRRFASHPLAEVKDLGKLIYEQVNPVAPSIVIFHEANDRDLKTYPQLKETAKKLIKKTPKAAKKIKEVDLVEFPKSADTLILAALLHSTGNFSYKQSKALSAKLNKAQREDFFKASFRNLQFYDSMLREFEYVNFTFNIVLSAACFGQLKRHRMATLTAQNYDPNLGVTIPSSIKEIGMEKYFQEIVDKTNEIYTAINKDIPQAAPYILTNAHRRRVLMHLSLRELYHISRLREDAHAQWDIQNISHLMSEETRKIMPEAAALLCGKDRYNQVYQNIFGHLPKVTEVSLPGARKIKDFRD